MISSFFPLSGSWGSNNISDKILIKEIQNENWDALTVYRVNYASRYFDESTGQFLPTATLGSGGSISQTSKSITYVIFILNANASVSFSGGTTASLSPGTTYKYIEEFQLYRKLRFYSLVNMDMNTTVIKSGRDTNLIFTFS